MRHNIRECVDLQSARAMNGISCLIRCLSGDMNRSRETYNRIEPNGELSINSKQREKQGTLPLKALEMFTGPNEASHYGSRKPADLWAIGLPLHDMIFGMTPYEGNTDAQTEALQVIKRFLVLSPFTRVAWHDIGEHPRIKNEWHKVHRRLPLYCPKNDEWVPTSGWKKFMYHRIIDTTIEVAFRCQCFYLSRSIPEDLKVEVNIQEKK
ncbi:hypothetical protein M422DRAFT_245469 [Sphaerobolus stellatus SS14]|nr:hypothetical protein M422DRAFT_245469 [Sphaerobolus stellatus SS14]